MRDASLSSTPRSDRTRDCLDPWSTVFVRASGEVALCCWSKPVGNMREHELSLIVDGADARKLRAGLLSGELDEACAHCPARGTTSTIQLHARVREYVEREREHRELVAHERVLQQRIAQLEYSLDTGGVGLWRRTTGPLKAWWRRKQNARSEHVELMRGCIESLTVRDGSLALSGWAFALDVEPTELALFVDDARVGALQRVERPDVALAYPRVAAAAHSGFSGTLTLPARNGSVWRSLSIVALRDGARVAHADLDFAQDALELGPSPPAHLMKRVAHIEAPELFRLDGMRAATEVLATLARHGLRESGTLLDWGAGCGRVLAVLRQRLPRWKLAGVDVDAEALEWLRPHAPGVELAVIAADPPTQLASGRFDAILGLSVMTHLDRARQREWLSELERIAAPGALVLLSVHGRYAARMIGREDVLEALATDGISDRTVDTTLAGVVSADRYRATFQSEAWTRRHWRGAFEVAEWIPGGLGGFQDLVVLRRRGASAR